MHRDCQSQHKLFWIWFRQCLEQAETLPLTIIARRKRTKHAFHHANNFTLLSVAPKKNKRVVYLSTMHSEKKRDEDTGKEEINVFYNQEKGGVDSHDQMCSLYTTGGRKKNPLANEGLLWNN